MVKGRKIFGEGGLVRGLGKWLGLKLWSTGRRIDVWGKPPKRVFVGTYGNISLLVIGVGRKGPRIAFNYTSSL